MNRAAHVRSTNLARPRPDPGTPRTTGIDKHPVPGIDVVVPGPAHGDGSGAVGDHVGDARHHGGADKAVYAVAREELDWWEGLRRLPADRRPRPGSPGDPVVLGDAPGHGVDLRVAFAAVMGDLDAARAVLEARCLPGRYYDAMARRVARRATV